MGARTKSTSSLIGMVLSFESLQFAEETSVILEFLNRIDDIDTNDDGKIKSVEQLFEDIGKLWSEHFDTLPEELVVLAGWEVRYWDGEIADSVPSYGYVCREDVWWGGGNRQLELRYMIT